MLVEVGFYISHELYGEYDRCVWVRAFDDEVSLRLTVGSQVWGNFGRA